MPELKSSDNFIVQIKDTLKNLNRRQIVFFAWLCAVRAFPLLGISEAIDFQSASLTKYLYRILRSLDMIVASAESIRVITATDAATTAIDADDIESKYGDDTRLAFKTVSFAARAAYASNIDISAAAEAAADVAINAAAGARYHNISLSDILLDDIRKIKNGEFLAFSHDIALYGGIWDHFMNSLTMLGCRYWGQLYEDIFSSGFMVSPEALERRISIPVEIQEQGAIVVGQYLQKLETQGYKCLNETRIIILGEKGAGKTCLARRLNDLNASMTEKEESTEGVATTLWKTSENEDTNVNVHIWDFAGHVITHAAHRCFLSERCLYIIVYDGRTEERNRLAYWLDHVRNYGGGAPVRVVVNMFDAHKPDIPVNTLREKYPNIYDFTYLSIEKDKQQLKEFRAETVAYIQNNPIWNCLSIPASYVNVKEALEKRFQKDSKNYFNEHISKDVFDRIVAENHIEGADALQLLKDLHELGICLWYHDIEEFNTLVLNPDWISHGIYSLINWAHNHSRHMVSLEDHEAIFTSESSRYPKDKLSFIFRLMKKYELAYSKETNDAITIPFLLREDQPINLPHFPIEESLLIQFVTEQPLPPNTVSRLIVRHSNEIGSHNEVWRYGVILHYKGDTVALVKEDDRKIIVKAKGVHKGECIARLRDTMIDIFNSYKGNKPEIQYKVIANELVVSVPYEQSDNKPLMLSDETIRSYIANGHPNYYYPQANLDIPLDRTANVYHIHAVNAAFGANSQINSNTFNFNSCNLALQGELRSLANTVSLHGYADVARDLESALSDLEKIEDMDTEKAIKKSGGLTKVRSFFEDMSNEQSTARKVIGKIKYGVQTVQGMAKIYNDIAQWVGLPQVPRPFLGES